MTLPEGEINGVLIAKDMTLRCILERIRSTWTNTLSLAFMAQLIELKPQPFPILQRPSCVLNYVH